ncbi:MAG: plasmid stabilization protein [Chloroflexi bacterium]|nr:plasmid stabilization protein [Chloroflexota bacterium]
MSYTVTTIPRFDRLARRFFRRHPDLRDRFARLVHELEVDPFQPHLRLHPLIGEFDGLHAVSLTYQYRVVLTLLMTERNITLIAIGSHDEVYS